ncbi:unnamed protein product [Calypogeia fissa]
MEFLSPTPVQARAPMTIYLVHRTQWYKYFHYRKWRCDETTDLMGAHSTLEGAHSAVVLDFKKKAQPHSVAARALERAERQEH